MSTEAEATVVPVQFYRIQNAWSLLYLAPKFPNDLASVLTQGDPTTSDNPAIYNWAFVKLGTNQYRIVNGHSGLCAASESTPPAVGQSLIQYDWNKKGVQRWNIPDGVFHTITTTESGNIFAWQAPRADDIGGEVRLFPQKNVAEQSWTFHLVATAQSAAAT